MSFTTREDADAYLRTYYTPRVPLDTEDTFLLDATLAGLALAARAGTPGATCLEIGCGPVVAWALCAPGAMETVWLGEASEGGRQAILDWLAGGPTAFDWTAYQAYVASQVGGPLPAAGGVAPGMGPGEGGARDPAHAVAASAANPPAACSGPAAWVADRLRRAVAGVVDVDVRAVGVVKGVVASRPAGGWASASLPAPPSASPPRAFDAVVMHSVADAISGDEAQFRSHVAAAAGLVSPGGVLLLSANTDVDTWFAEDRAFPQVRLSDAAVVAAVEAAGLVTAIVRKHSRDGDGPKSETDNTIFLAATRPKGSD